MRSGLAPGLGVRSFSILPASLSPESPQVTEETLHTASTTDEQLTPVSTFFDFIVHPLSDGLMDIPHPWGYGVSIIFLTLVVRSVFTLPISLWQRKRSLRVKNLVQPELKVINERLAQSVMIDCRKRGVGYEQYTLELRRQVSRLSRESSKALHKKYSTNPTITTYSPLLVHIPIFVTLSLTIRRTLELANSPFFDESFLWLDKLGEVDPYSILPLVGSCLAFGNAELIGRKPKSSAEITDEAIKAQQTSSSSSSSSLHSSQTTSRTPPRHDQQSSNPKPSPLFSKPSSSSSAASTTTIPNAQKPPNQRRKLTTTSTTYGVLQQIQREKRRAVAGAGLVDVEKSPNPNRTARWSPARQQEVRRGFMASVLRFSAVGFGLIASQMPAGVTLYWVTSIGFSFVQNLVLSWYPQYKAEREAAKRVAVTTDKSVV